MPAPAAVAAAAPAPAAKSALHSPDNGELVPGTTFERVALSAIDQTEKRKTIKPKKGDI